MTKTFPKNPMYIHSLMDRIMDALLHDSSIVAYSIKNAYNDRVPFSQIIGTIQSQMKDNPRIGKELFGETLLKEIQEY